MIQQQHNYRYFVGVFKTKIFQNFVSFRINFLGEEFYSVLKSKQFRFVMRSKQNRERLDSSHVTNMLYARATLNTPSGHLPLSYEFLKEDEDTDE